jgi:hypothetical protein
MNTQMPVKELLSLDIIMNDHTCQNGEGERVLEVIEERLNNGNSLLIRKYNSLYLITRLAVGEAEGHFYSVDSAIYAVRAVKYFIEQTKESGVHTLYIYDFSDPNMKRMLEMIKLTVQPSDKKEFNYMINLGRSM